MKYLHIAVAVVSLGLIANSIANFRTIQAKADLSADARSEQVRKYFATPLACGVGLIAGWCVAGVLGLFDPAGPQSRTTLDSLKSLVKTTATPTTITLREPNIDLRIVLSGEAAKDPEGRRRIGAVTDWYASGQPRSTEGGGG